MDLISAGINIVIWTRVGGHGRAPLDLGTIVTRLRMSVPLLQHTLFYQQLRQLVLSSLIA